MSSAEYYENLRKNGGEPPKEIDEERFWYLLEVLPPCKWSNFSDSESFYVSEAATEDLHTWAVRVTAPKQQEDGSFKPANTYYELITSKHKSHSQVMDIVYKSLEA